MLKVVLITFTLLLSSQGWGQKRCMQFCFDVTKKGESIANGSVSKKDMDSLGLTITFFNCGDKDFQAPPTPYVTKGYADKTTYTNPGKNCFHIMLFVDRYNIMYEPYFMEQENAPASRPTSKKISKSIIVHPNKEVIITDYYWTDYLKNLPPGKYEIALDYADEFKETKPPKNDSIIAKYYKTDQPISSGAYMQFSKNTVRFTVVE